MLGRTSSKPSLFQRVKVESLVPSDHQFRKIDAALDLSRMLRAGQVMAQRGSGASRLIQTLAVRIAPHGKSYGASRSGTEHRPALRHSRQLSPYRVTSHAH